MAVDIKSAAETVVGFLGEVADIYDKLAVTPKEQAELQTAQANASSAQDQLTALRLAAAQQTAADQDAADRQAALVRTAGTYGLVAVALLVVVAIFVKLRG